MGYFRRAGVAAIFSAMVLVPSLAEADDVAEEVEEVRSLFFKQAAEAREEYRNDLRRHARIAVGKLEKVGAAAIREGNLAAATTAWKQVLWLDRENRKAVAHFKAIGRLDEVLKELENEPLLPTSESGGSSRGGGASKDFARKLVGTSWSWGSSTLTFQEEGVASVAADARPNSRIWRVDDQGNVYIAQATGDSMAVVIMDIARGVYSGKNYKILDPNFKGRRSR